MLSNGSPRHCATSSTRPYRQQSTGTVEHHRLNELLNVPRCQTEILVCARGAFGTNAQDDVEGDHRQVAGFVTASKCDPCHSRPTNLLCVQLVGLTKESGARDTAVLDSLRAKGEDRKQRILSVAQRPRPQRVAEYTAGPDRRRAGVSPAGLRILQLQEQLLPRRARRPRRR